MLSRVNLAQESVDQVVDGFGQLGAIGTGHVIIGLPGVYAEDAFEGVPDLVAQVNGVNDPQPVQRDQSSAPGKSPATSWS